MFLSQTTQPLGSLVICRWFEIRVEGNHLCDEVVPLLFKLLAGTELSSVKPLPLAIVDGLGGRGPVGNRPLYCSAPAPLIPTWTITRLPQPSAFQTLTTLFGGTDRNVCYSDRVEWGDGSWLSIMGTGICEEKNKGLLLKVVREGKMSFGGNL